MLLQLDVPCLVDTPGKPALFLKENKEVDWGEWVYGRKGLGGKEDITTAVWI